MDKQVESRWEERWHEECRRSSGLEDRITSLERQVLALMAENDRLKQRLLQARTRV